MTIQNKAETLALLTEWAAMHARTEALVDGVHAVFGSTPESKLFETVWTLFNAYTTALSVQLGDDSLEPGATWLSWYCWDNAMGADKKQAGYDGKPRKIENLNHLHWLINEGRKR